MQERKWKEDSTGKQLGDKKRWARAAICGSTAPSQTLLIPCLLRACILSCFSCVWLFANLWTVAHQIPLSLGFSRQEYWIGLPFLSSRDLLTQGSNPGLLHCRWSTALQADSLLPEPPSKPSDIYSIYTVGPCCSSMKWFTRKEGNDGHLDSHSDLY